MLTEHGERFVNPLDKINCREGVIELDPYNSRRPYFVQVHHCAVGRDKSGPYHGHITSLAHPSRALASSAMRGWSDRGR